MTKNNLLFVRVRRIGLLLALLCPLTSSGQTVIQFDSPKKPVSSVQESLPRLTDQTISQLSKKASLPSINKEKTPLASSSRLQEVLQDQIYRLPCGAIRSEKNTPFKIGNQSCQVQTSSCTLLQGDLRAELIQETFTRVQLIYSGLNPDLGYDLEKQPQLEDFQKSLLNLRRAIQLFSKESPTFQSALKKVQADLLEYRTPLEGILRKGPKSVCNLHGDFIPLKEIRKNHREQSCGKMVGVHWDYDVLDGLEVYLSFGGIGSVLDYLMTGRELEYGTLETSFEAGSVLIQNLACQSKQLLNEVSERKIKLTSPYCKVMAAALGRQHDQFDTLLMDLGPQEVNQMIREHATDERLGNSMDLCFADEFSMIDGCNQSAHRTQSQLFCKLQAASRLTEGQGAVSRITSCELHSRVDRFLTENLLTREALRDLENLYRTKIVGKCARKAEKMDTGIRAFDVIDGDMKRRVSSFFRCYVETLPEAYLEYFQKRLPFEGQCESPLGLAGLFLFSLGRRRKSEKRKSVALILLSALALNACSDVTYRVQAVCRGRDGFRIHEAAEILRCCDLISPPKNGFYGLRSPYPDECPQPPALHALQHLETLADLIYSSEITLSEARDLVQFHKSQKATQAFDDSLEKGSSDPNKNDLPTLIPTGIASPKSVADQLKDSQPSLGRDVRMNIPGSLPSSSPQKK